MTGTKTTHRPLWVGLLVNIIVALVVVSLVQAFLVKVYRVPSGSMEQTLQAAEGGGDRILVNRTAYRTETPDRGDVVVFSRPETWTGETAPGPAGNGLQAAARAFGDITGIGASNEQYLVKRVVAVEGDTISCCSPDGSLLVNGASIEEPYIYQDFPYMRGVLDCQSQPASLRCFSGYTVPEGGLVVLGDHRSQSADSAILCRTPAAPLESTACMRNVPTSAVVGHVFFRAWPLHRIGGVD